MSFNEFLGSMVVFFFWVMYLWMFIAVFGDIFRRDDLSGWAKAGWVFLIFFLPLLGILLYLVVRPRMADQDRAMSEASRESQRRMSGLSASEEIEKAKRLLDSGVITAEEFEAMKRRALTAL